MMYPKPDYKTATRDELVQAIAILDIAVSNFQKEVFDIAARGGHSFGCPALEARECRCYKMQIAHAIRQLILGRMVSELQLGDGQTEIDHKQMEFNLDGT